MTGKEIAMRLKEGDSAYQEFFRGALKKFGSKTPADMSDEEKDKFFTWIEKNWTDENPETDDNDVVDEECDGIPKGTGKLRGRKLSRDETSRAGVQGYNKGLTNKKVNKKYSINKKNEEHLRAAIRKEIANALSEIKLQEGNVYHFKNLIRGGLINVNLANDKAAQKYADRLGSRWQMVNIGEAIDYLQELAEQDVN